MARTQAFFERHGGLSLVLARFVPVVRTVAPPLAGMGRLPWPRFQTYNIVGDNIVGGLLWAVSVPTLGYWLGGLIPDLDRYILLVVGVAVVLSLIPVALELRKLRAGRP